MNQRPALVAIAASAVAALLTLIGCGPLLKTRIETTITGKVINSNGAPVPSAVVHLFQTAVVTDANGCFRIAGQDRQSSTLEVLASGYDPFVMNAVEGNYQLRITLRRPMESEWPYMRWQRLEPDPEMDAGGCR